MTDNNNQNNQQPNTQPEGNGGERMFTQDEVNRIVQDRLNRERGKAAPGSDREQQLTARENALACREYLAEKGYPASLMDVFSTTDSAAFEASVEKMIELFPAAFSQRRMDTGMSHQNNSDGSTSTLDADLRNAFNLK